MPEGGKMDWKVYYRAEIARPEGRDAIVDFLETGGDPKVEGAIGRGAIVSFPHTALSYAGPLQARLVSAIYRPGIDRIVALGVLHGIGIEAFRTARDPSLPPNERKAAFKEVAGGFSLPADTYDTPFGGYPVWRPADDGPIRIDRSGILGSEFSLDTFASILKLGADLFGEEEIPIFPVYVGMTSDPIEGGFDLAFNLAKWLRGIVRPGTALVTTGDLVHYGTAYAGPGEPVEDDPSLTGRFRSKVERMLDSGLIEGDLDGAYRMGTEVLKSDQREILPVIGAYLGGEGSYEIIEFDLSDYAGILDVDPPCRVASALIIYG